MRACVKKLRELAVAASSWNVPVPLSIVNEGFVELRNSSTLIKLGDNNALIWGGRAPSLAKQAIDSTTNLLRMGQELEKLMPVLNADSKMLSVFQAAHGNKPKTHDAGLYRVAKNKNGLKRNFNTPKSM